MLPPSFNSKILLVQPTDNLVEDSEGDEQNLLTLALITYGVSTATISLRRGVLRFTPALTLIRER